MLLPNEIGHSFERIGGNCVDVHVGGPLQGVPRTIARGIFSNLQLSVVPDNSGESRRRYPYATSIEDVLVAAMQFHAARTVVRNFSTSVFKRLLSLDSERADANTCPDAAPVALAP